MGNSSSGIIEAPFFQLPFVNVGSRQRNRAHAANVIHVDYDATRICAAIVASLLVDRKTAVANPYDLLDNPEQQTLQLLKQLHNHPQLLNKSFI
ncbi:UDP-N,N'-diacetylbacillosamine 2-epimerase (hydrolyzing) [compost metagenome]